MARVYPQAADRATATEKQAQPPDAAMNTEDQVDIIAKERLSIITRILRERGIDINDKERPVLFSGQKGFFSNGVSASTFERGRAWTGQGFYVTDNPEYALKYIGFGDSENRTPTAYLAVIQLSVPVESIFLINIYPNVIRGRMAMMKALNEPWSPDLYDRTTDAVIAKLINGAPAFRFFPHGQQEPQDIAIRDPHIIVGGEAIALDLRRIALPGEIKEYDQKHGEEYRGIGDVTSVPVNIKSFNGLYSPVQHSLVDIKKGGIDFKPDKVDSAFAVKNSGGEISAKGGSASGGNFHIDPAMLEQLQNAPGFVPVIINIQPVDDLRLFLGIKENASNQPAGMV